VGGVGKHGAAQPLAIHPTAIIQHAAAEPGGHGGDNLVAEEDLMGHGVGVDHPRTKTGEHTSHGGLARGDPTREAGGDHDGGSVR